MMFFLNVRACVPRSVRLASPFPLLLQELDESGAEVFTLLLPSGTPLPARRHCVLSGDGKLSSVCMNIYQKLLSEQPQQLARVRRRQEGTLG